MHRSVDRRLTTALVTGAVLLAGSATPLIRHALASNSCRAVHKIAAGWTMSDVPSFPAFGGLPGGGPATLETMVGQDPNTLLATDGSAVVRSTDGGCGWSQTYTVAGLPDYGGGSSAASYFVSTIVNAHSAGPSGSQTVYLLLTPNQLAGFAALDAAPPPEIVMVSHDGGTTFRMVQPAPSASAPVPLQCAQAPDAVAVSPADTGVLYVHCQPGPGQQVVEAEASSPEGFFLRSYDGGASWSVVGLPKGGMSPRGGVQLVVNPVNARQIWLAGSVFVAEGSSKTRLAVWRSTDAGATWIQSYPAGQALSSNVAPVIAVDTAIRSGPAHVAAYSVDGAYLSQDGGKTWRTLRPPPVARVGQPRAVTSFFANHTLFVELAGAGIFCRSAALLFAYAGTQAAKPVAFPKLTAGSPESWDVTPAGMQATAPFGAGLVTLDTSTLATRSCDPVQKWLSYSAPVVKGKKR